MSSKRLLEHGLSVGYISGAKQLIVTVTRQMAKRMETDGWQVHHEKEIGYFVTISLQEPDGN